MDFRESNDRDLTISESGILEKKKFYVIFMVAQVEYAYVTAIRIYGLTTTAIDRMPRGHGYFYRIHSSRIQNSPLSVLP